MLREARVLRALHDRARVPRVLAVCPEADVLGVPFYVMEELRGHVVTEELPGSLAGSDARRTAGNDLVDALVELHAVDIESAGLADFGRPAGYLERQLKRFMALWEHNATREQPLVGELAAWLATALPPAGDACVVHGDYRLGNVMLDSARPRVLALLDWELATLGDPLADLGYLVATWSDASSPPTVLDLSPVTRHDGFPSRAELAERYGERSGRAVGALGVVRGARTLEGCGLLRGPVRPLPAWRDRRSLDGEPRRRARPAARRGRDRGTAVTLSASPGALVAGDRARVGEQSAGGDPGRTGSRRCEGEGSA